jgi:hypothetical protein
MSGNGSGVEAPAGTPVQINGKNDSHVDNNGQAVKIDQPPAPVIGSITGGNNIVAPNANTPITQNNYGPAPPRLANFVEHDPVVNNDGTYSWRINFDILSDSVPQNIIIAAKSPAVIKIAAVPGSEGRLMFNTDQPPSNIAGIVLFKLDSPTGRYAFDVVTSDSVQKPLIGYAFNVVAAEKFYPKTP